MPLGIWTMNSTLLQLPDTNFRKLCPIHSYGMILVDLTSAVIATIIFILMYNLATTNVWFGTIFQNPDTFSAVHIFGYARLDHNPTHAWVMCMCIMIAPCKVISLHILCRFKTVMIPDTYCMSCHAQFYSCHSTITFPETESKSNVQISLKLYESSYSYNNLSKFIPFQQCSLVDSYIYSL